MDKQPHRHVRITMHESDFEDLTQYVVGDSDIDMGTIAREQPHEAYELITKWSGLYYRADSVDINVNGVQKPSVYTLVVKESQSSTNHFEVYDNLPNKDIEPIQLVLSVWRKQTFRDRLLNRPKVRPVLSLHTSPNNFAF